MGRALFLSKYLLVDMKKLLLGILALLGLSGNADSSNLNYRKFERWVNASLEKGVPSQVCAFCFNLYEDVPDGRYSVEIVGASSFDKDDSDWACDEVFTNRENPLRWTTSKSWDKVQLDVEVLIRKYLQHGKYAQLLRSKKGVACGFVEGELELILP